MSEESEFEYLGRIIEKNKRGRCGNCDEFDPRPGHDLGAETGYCLEYRIHVFRQNPCQTDSGFKPKKPDVKP